MAAAVTHEIQVLLYSLEIDKRLGIDRDPISAHGMSKVPDVGQNLGRAGTVYQGGEPGFFFLHRKIVSFHFFFQKRDASRSLLVSIRDFQVGEQPGVRFCPRQIRQDSKGHFLSFHFDQGPDDLFLLIQG